MNATPDSIEKVKYMNKYTITIEVHPGCREERTVWAATALAAKRRLILARFRNHGLSTKIVSVSKDH